MLQMMAARARKNHSATYAATVLSFNPVAYWRLGDSGSTAVDSSGHSHSGTYTGSLAQAQTSILPHGQGNSMISSTGSSYVDLAGMNGFVFSFPFTIIVWVKPSSFTATASVIFTGGTGCVQFGFNATGNPLWGRSSVVNFTPSTTTCVTGTVYCLGISVDASGNYTYYVNGSAAGSFTGGTAAANFASAKISIFNDGTNYNYRGNMQELALFNTALSAANHSTIFAAG